MKQEEEVFSEAFPFMDIEEEEDEEEIEPVYFFLDSDNEVPYSIFKTLAMFLTENYSIDSALMIELVKEHNLPAQRTYTQLAYILSGYSHILLAARQESNGPENIENPRTTN